MRSPSLSPPVSPPSCPLGHLLSHSTAWPALASAIPFSSFQRWPWGLPLSFLFPLSLFHSFSRRRSSPARPNCRTALASSRFYGMVLFSFILLSLRGSFRRRVSGRLNAYKLIITFFFRPLLIRRLGVEVPGAVLVDHLECVRGVSGDVLENNRYPIRKPSCIYICWFQWMFS